jgi:ABC-type cobalamin/Fe3+-siderophores transport system ATPase subunit
MEHRKLFLIYEGISGSGKSTLLTKLMEKRNFVDYALHRGPATEWVYGTLAGRIIYMDQIFKFESDIQKVLPTVLITLTANGMIALQRKQMLGDEKIENLEEASKLFYTYHHSLSTIKTKCYYDTSVKTVNESANLLYEFLLEVQRDNYDI